MAAPLTSRDGIHCKPEEMSLAPLLNASPIIQLHAFAAMTAFVLGVVQLSAPKGTISHERSAGSGSY